ncbi:MAG: 50S ribosomal protein L35 [marine bacterium B5-7]|nr:MAG: 50S ribosomal protein L35 [marine bacterium B5-7]
MPKLKTKSSAKKRFIRTKGGLKFRRANRGHILTKHSTKKKRHVRGNSLLKACDTNSVARQLCEK